MHGKTSTYTLKKCRCDECRRAWREYCKALRRRKVKEGRCIECSQLSLPLSVRCDIHRLKMKVRTEQMRARMDAQQAA